MMGKRKVHIGSEGKVIRKRGKRVREKKGKG